MRKIINYLLLFSYLFFFPILVLAKGNDEITLYFFHGDGCPHCAEEEKFLKTIEDKYDNFKIIRYEVWYDEDNAKLLKKVEDAFDITRSGVPRTVIGNTIIGGYGPNTGSKIERAIQYYQEHDYVDNVSKIIDGSFNKEELPDDDFEKEEEKSDKEMSIDLPIIGKINLKRVSLTTAAVVIGFVDGFNPCAMWILLFLISILIGLKDRKRMLVLGLTFLITSALVYMLIMLSWIQIAVKITTVIWVRNLIAIAALIGAFINIRSYLKSNDSGCDVVDDKKRKKIFKKIRKFTSEKSLILALIGVIGLVVSVNLVELACSAGLPLIFSELLVLNQVGSFMRFMYTLLYIFFFLIDDLVVFFLAMFTMKVSGISTKYNKYSHLVGGLLLLLIGVLLLIKPEWLMFQFK